MMKIILQIDGMMCPMCEAHVNDAIRRNFKVGKVTSSHKEKTTVILAETDIPDEQLRDCVTGMGYSLLGVSRECCEKKRRTFFK